MGFKETSFADLPSGVQRGEFIGSPVLTPPERQMIEDLVNWNNPNQHLPALFQVHGRSLVFRSPAPPVNDYLGLQLIGACGSEDVLGTRFIHPDDAVRINPVNPDNHAQKLSSILQLSKIDEQGVLQLWYRDYAPLHGMGADEADSRYAMTLNLMAGPVPFSVPSAAADGRLLGKTDPQGRTLRFQVYRVPLIERFPNQIFRLAEATGHLSAMSDLHLGSVLAGQMFRYLHRYRVAYKDGHLGNMSLLMKDEKTGLYITDLGSMEDFSRSAYHDRYRALDFHVFFTSAQEFRNLYLKYLQMSKSEIDQDSAYRDIVTAVVAGVLQGYFNDEYFKIDTANPGGTWIEAHRQNTADMIELLSSIPTSQEFIEAFEQFFKDFTES